ncbi:MAG: ATP synthase F1 subunit gamma [Lachnospiraceae bacterium]|nr:ATP synthase F1 subunit gamma [Lachnospiraceae bacterium]
MASMRDIKRRKESVQSTGQITKAMKLVSTVKLQKARGRAERSKPYFDRLYETIVQALARSGNIQHKYLTAGSSPKKAIIVISSNRGLAGGYNSNVIKLVTRGEFKKEDVVIYNIGTKGLDAFKREGYEIKADYSDVIESPLFSDAIHIGADVLKAFIEGEVGEIYLAYTAFKNTVTHVPTLRQLLPVDSSIVEDAMADHTPMNYEPGEDEALNIIIPKYLNSLIYDGLIEAVASENGARMQAMDNATNNAEEMISDLTLLYNRARQGSITQELTEIIAGASAIS